MRVRIDPERCQGHLRCVAFAPGVFAADDQGFGYVAVDVVPAGLEADTNRAILSCPEQAIAEVGTDG
jgi:ferredoxin